LPSTQRKVHFLDTGLLDPAGSRSDLAPGYWAALDGYLSPRSPQDRVHTYRGSTYFGEARISRAPAFRYVYLGRVRALADSPDAYRPGVGVLGAVRHEQPGDRIAEPTYLIPIDGSNRVAIMSPVRGGTSVSAIESWLSAHTPGLPTGTFIDLLPVLDRDVAAKLGAASGASAVTLRAPHDAEITEEDGDLGAAFEAARRIVPNEAVIEINWSLGNRSTTDGSRQRIVDVARRVLNRPWLSKAKVNLELPVETDDGVKLRHEVHDLIKDVMSEQATFTLQDDQVPTPEAVLPAMYEAVQRFRRRV